MNVKKIAAVSALVLVLVGCIIAAGCTETPDTPVAPVTPVSDGDGIVGTWGVSQDVIDVMIESMKNLAIAFGTPEDEIDIDEIRAAFSDMGTYRFDPDGTGKIIFGEEEAVFSWKNLGDGKYVIITGDEETELVLDPSSGKLSDESGFIGLERLLA